MLSNLLALVLFGRHRALRSPINLLLVNICLSDLLVCALATPLSLAASARGHWLAGRTACVWYGFANSLFVKSIRAHCRIFFRLIPNRCGFARDCAYAKLNKLKKRFEAFGDI
ncbi:vertebrate ancient opsin-like [Clarias magur]|uniref:Vertebrate ancient opsin-like n=1 Tax=Clarias magur TaxID=1594786 RepID=A0A8J4XCT0_CLAMG|nr:vertebrate ancient opsin-like [Clarias magur]